MCNIHTPTFDASPFCSRSPPAQVRPGMAAPTRHQGAAAKPLNLFPADVPQGLAACPTARKQPVSDSSSYTHWVGSSVTHNSNAPTAKHHGCVHRRSGNAATPECYSRCWDFFEAQSQARRDNHPSLTQTQQLAYRNGYLKLAHGSVGTAKSHTMAMDVHPYSNS